MDNSTTPVMDNGVKKRKRLQKTSKINVSIDQIPTCDRDILCQQPSTENIRQCRALDLLCIYVSYKETALAQKWNPRIFALASYLASIKTLSVDVHHHVPSRHVVSDISAVLCALLVLERMKTDKDILRKHHMGIETLTTHRSSLKGFIEELYHSLQL